MLVSSDEKAIEKARFLSTQARDKARHYQHSQLGFNYRMSNVVAGIGRGQLIHLEEHKRKKKEIYRQYKEAFADIPAVAMNPMNPDGDANNWLSCMTIDPDSGVTPDMVMDALEAENIESRPIWKPMHLQPFYENVILLPWRKTEAWGNVSSRRDSVFPATLKIRRRIWNSLSESYAVFLYKDKMQEQVTVVAVQTSLNCYRKRGRHVL